MTTLGPKKAIAAGINPFAAAVSTGAVRPQQQQVIEPALKTEVFDMSQSFIDSNTRPLSPTEWQALTMGQPIVSQLGMVPDGDVRLRDQEGRILVSLGAGAYVFLEPTEGGFKESLALVIG